MNPLDDRKRLTFEAFLEQRADLPEQGRWCELIEGELVSFAAPDSDHGNIILHLSKALAASAQQRPIAPGATCFRLGVLLGRQPDTLLQPAVSHFRHRGPFELTDEEFTEDRPDLVVEIVSTSDRRRCLERKLAGYRAAEIESVLVVDLKDRVVTAHLLNDSPRRFEAHERLAGDICLGLIDLEVESLFTPPEWWTPGKGN